jgi:hypothetical protein
MTGPTWAAALRAGAHTTHEGEITVEDREIGRLRLPSGRVVAADPFVEPDLPPFTRRVYPIRLAIAHYPEGRDQRVAAAWLAISDEPAATWEPAQLEGYPRRADEAAAYAVADACHRSSTLAR